MERFDVAILGGGPAGASAAITLAGAGVGCVLIERRTTPAWKIGETLAPEARQILQALDVWEDFQRDGHRPSPGIRSSWGESAIFDRDFIFNPHGSAWQLNRPQFEQRLLQAAEQAGAPIWRGNSTQRLERVRRRWQIETSGGRQCRAAWVLDATGRGSTILKAVGAKRHFLDKLVAVFALAPPTTDGAADARTYVESTRDGWSYSALLPDSRRLFAFQTDGDLLRGKDWRNPRWLRRQLRRTDHIRLLLPARTRFIGQSKLTSAQSSRLVPCAGEGWMAIGDAAQSFDPLSGEGLFHALYSGNCAALAVQSELAGEHSGRTEYIELLGALWHRYAHHYHSIYSAETRWRTEPFWQRRAKHTSEENHGDFTNTSRQEAHSKAHEKRLIQEG